MQQNVKPKVVTVTLNPALDLTGSLQSLSLGSVSVVEQGSLHPAGKGVNVAKVLAELGADVTVTGLLGADNQESFCQLFKAMGATDKFVRVAGANRINVKLVEKNGQVSDINFPGVAVTAANILAFEKKLFELAATHDVFVIAGSLPQGVSADMCANWLEKLHQLGKKVLFDSSKLALATGLDAHPWLVKPNDEELAEWAGQALDTPQQCMAVAETIAAKGITNVVVSLGAKGVMWFNDQGWLHAQPPKMDVVSTVGAGDTLVAGLCWGEINQWSKTQSLQFATALSAVAVTQVGVGVDDIEQVTTIAQQVILTQ
ncbi:1-phosphofructokinase [Photobacterium aquimaris]|uniref:Phosphofructokinase n=1 Tax=Photobacterium aquimaris TaxID=512643 RepID=A0A2T3ITE9_9GAMM|nr:1-phosphofructokinase [Photobacterium aquimaris]OBU18887.1 1-phosphofructokinase [Photobacterium aquimaris]OBU20780.1 1-phosphofructokinase [Photobacterium aquimaris]PSU31634.1 1-phosphofructokinase [Photobacterium aquimaris]PSW03318.1 1-phosphofructokinase [Photobacterium aquimaris]